MDEFIEFGYDLASTNRIVERAGIAKGTLFKYFSSKEELFYYVIDQFADKIRPFIYSLDGKEPEGLFETLKYMTMKKASLRFTYPREYALVLQLVTNYNHPIYRKILEKFTSQSMELFERLIEKVDTSMLRPGVSPEELFRVVGWTLRGMEDYILEQAKHVPYSQEFEQSIYDQFDRLCDLLKYGLYKPEAEKPASPMPEPEPAAVALLP